MFQGFSLLFFTPIKVKLLKINVAFDIILVNVIINSIKTQTEDKVIYFTIKSENFVEHSIMVKQWF